MYTVKELIEQLKKCDQDSVVAIQYGFVNGLVKSIDTIKISQDARFHDKLKIRAKWRGDIPVTFITMEELGVREYKNQLYA